jgi:molybdopterin biosynthesis enzyme MoaB
MSKRINEEVLQLIKERLEAGAKKYGEEILIDDKRDMIQESLEEMLDSCVYLACKIIQLKDKENEN